ncbi:YfkD famly protein [Halalkalibacter sp. APA_J-10(15)]|uniref:YfkD famly protein n=1 Tax=Halalkalibacter sp. APA_J-10(15) TaxID=2933805 RepID=UPI001FF24EBE|nr:YfkD famly protein [Halalkalibacter sp. APA_J-10(15)]MCK0472453.1 YfkD family protein [Halalkalibacter sp. APA_J-10(15)]
MKRVLILFIVILSVIVSPIHMLAESEDDKTKEKENNFDVPDTVIKIGKENTYTNPTQDLPYLQPSELAEELMGTTDITIENPDLVKLLNESTIQYSKLAIGFRASIYLGEWPLSYQSDSTEVNWQHQKINTNFVDNRGGNSSKKLSYYQEQQKKFTGGLTAKIPNSDAVKKMMMIHAAEVTNLPLAFETVIGQGTRKQNEYNVPAKQVGYLYSHVPAIHEKGKVTYGEVYLTFKGGKRKLEVKNVTQQGVGSWIPVQDHLSFTFISSSKPR